jgi:hypothetical protein
VTSEGHPHAEFQRALKNGNVWVAEAVARELQPVWLEDALKLTCLYAEKEQWEKYERAAMNCGATWLRRSRRSRSSRGRAELKVAPWLPALSEAGPRRG